MVDYTINSCPDTREKNEHAPTMALLFCINHTWATTTADIQEATPTLTIVKQPVKQ
jgi:hypothetical protein